MKLGQGNIFSSVCQEFCSPGGGSAPLHAGIHTLPPGADTPPGADISLGADTCQEQTPPEADISPMQCKLGDKGNKRAVRTLLECILVHYLIFSLATSAIII